MKINEVALNRLPKSILEELEERQKNIVFTGMKAKTKIGEELKRAQDLLAKNGYGCFGEWLEFIGVGKSTAYNYINRYETIIQNLDNQNFEELPDSIIYEYAKPSTPPETKQAIEDGEITTIKQLNEHKQKLKEAESKINELKNHAKGLEEANQKLIQEISEPAEVKEVVKEVVKIPDDYENLKRQAEFYRKASGESSKAYENILSENMALRQQTKEKTYYKGLDIGVFVAYLREFISNMKKYEAFKDDFKNLTLEDERTIEMWINRTRDQLTVMEMLKNNMEVTIIE